MTTTDANTANGLSKHEQVVLDAITKFKRPRSKALIARKLGKSERGVTIYLNRLIGKNQIVSDDKGRYSVPKAAKTRKLHSARKRRTPGQTRDAIVDVITETPELTVAQIAKRVGAGTELTRKNIVRLAKDGAIEVTGREPGKGAAKKYSIVATEIFIPGRRKQTETTVDVSDIEQTIADAVKTMRDVGVQTLALNTDGTYKATFSTSFEFTAENA